MFKIAVLVSGGGSNLQSIIDKLDEGFLKCKIECVISDRVDAFALKRAENNKIKTYVIPRGDGMSEDILKILDGKVDLIVLAGFLSILKGEILERFKNKIINIHPSLIPSFCGDGMYGMKVHRAVIESGVKVSGCTVHFVSEETDAGPIIIQRVVPVYDTDTPEELQVKVLKQEHEALPEALKYISEGRLRVDGRRVLIDYNRPLFYGITSVYNGC